ncbi:exoribonuclease II [Spirochaetia bacterium]|nr:exoribonuclease II [Spirochaetia bacterium]
MNNNSLAVYKGRPAMITEIGDKISITVGGGKKETPVSAKAGTPVSKGTLKVREKDIEILHPGPVKNLAELGTAETGDPRGAWELIESGGAPVSLRELAELAYGEFTPQSAWNAWLLLADGLFFTGTSSEIQARSAAEVNAAEEKRQGKMKETQEREEFLDRLRAILQAAPASSLEDSRGLPADDGRFLQDVEALAYGKSDKSRTMKDLGRSETPQEAHRLLLECGFWNNQVNPHPRRCGLTLNHSDTSLLETGTSEANGLEQRDLTRQDLTHLPAFAIDNPWSDDPDDAVSLETDGNRRILYVHVADPACLINAGSPADVEARSRGATLYLPEGIWRMLPEEALPRFALGLSKTSPALTFKITLSGKFDGEKLTAIEAIEDTEIFPSMVNVTRLSYEEADTAKYAAILKELFTLGELNLERRLNAGGVNITLPEVHLTAEGAKVEIRPIVPRRSALMVRECMLLAGEGAAAWAAQRRLPFPYITQEIGELPAKPLPGLAGNYQLRRCMRPRSVSARPGYHWGLGLEAYSQVTSPLRRYTDLLAHQQIRTYLGKEAGPADQAPKGEAPLSEEEVLLRLAAADAASQAITQTERASKAFWTSVYLMEFLGPGAKQGEPVWDAVALDKRPKGTGIIIPELGLETQLGGVSAEPNELLRVRLKSVRIPEAEAVFVLEKFIRAL